MLFIVANDFFFSLERASESIHQLKYALEDKQFAKDDSEAGSDQSSEDRGSDDVDRGNDDSGNAAWQELQNSHAGKMTLKANGLKIVKMILMSMKKVNIFVIINVFYLVLVNQLKFLLEHQERMESEVSLSRTKMSFYVCFFSFFLLCCLNEWHAS